VSAEYARGLQARRTHEEAVRRSWRVQLVLALGPVTVGAGVVWAFAQPWRLTLLHPDGQGFWWLFAEPPLFVALVGILFRLVIARGLVEDLEAGER
jgi:hypothetical protein